MSEVEQIENRIKSRSPNELAQLRAWFAEFDADAWDRQLEADSADGKLDNLIRESMAEYRAGKTRPI